MNLTITGKVDNLKDFATWLIPKIREYVWYGIDDRKLILIDTYLNNSNTITFDYGIKRLLKSKDILIGALYNLKVNNKRESIDIAIDSNITIPGTSAKFINIAKLINYGNLQISGYRILDDCMNHFAINIDKYYKDFLEEVA